MNYRKLKPGDMEWNLKTTPGPGLSEFKEGGDGTEIDLKAVIDFIEGVFRKGEDYKKMFMNQKFHCRREGFNGFDRCAKQCKGCKALSE